MSSRTAEGVYITLLKGLQFLVDYFRYIKHPELLHLILMKMLNDSLAEAFFGHLTEMIPGNNLTFMQMARLVASEAFHYLLIVLSSSENVGISIRRSRHEHPGTYFYSSIDDRRDGGSGELLWLFFNAKHKTLFTTEDIRRAKRNDDEGLSKMLYMGKMDVCESFLSKLTTNETTAEGKAALRAVTMATKSRKIKTLRDFQKRRYGTVPAIFGQHSQRLGIDIPELPTRFLHDNDFVDEDEEENLDGLDISSENEGNSADPEHLLKKEEIAVLRGTDGLPFNLLKFTKDYRYNLTPQTKTVGNFLVESETLENGSVVFKETDQWRGASMTFAHILQTMMKMLSLSI